MGLALFAILVAVIAFMITTGLFIVFPFSVFLFPIIYFSYGFKIAILVSAIFAFLQYKFELVYSINKALIYTIVLVLLLSITGITKLVPAYIGDIISVIVFIVFSVYQILKAKEEDVF